MKLKLKYFDPSDITTFVNKGTGKHIISDGFTTIPVYKGKQYSIKDVVNSDGTVNIRKAKKIMEEVAEYFGGKKMQNRPENSVWHKDDPNTWLHTKKVAKNAWAIPVPEGYTKQDQMVAALGHDFGKILSGDGHAEVSYNLIKQIFPDATEKQLNAIRKHMNPIQEIVKEVKKLGNKDQQYFADQLTTATKFADIGVIPGADLTQLGLTPEELEIVKQTKWFKEGGTINKFQNGGTLSRWSIEQKLPIFRHLKNVQLAQNIDQDLNEFFDKGEIQYGQLSKDARRELQRKYNLDQRQIKETLDDLYNAGLGKALIADLITANINLASFKSGGVIQKCSIGSAIKKFAGEGLAGIEKNIIKETGENVALQATGNTKVIGKATTEHLRKVAKATNDQRIKVLADFAEQCRDKGIKLPEEFNQFVDSIFKTPVATKTDKKIIRVGKEVTADPEIITHNGVSIERPTFDKIKYKTKTIHTGEFKDKLEFKRTIPKTQQELQELSPKIDEAINSLRSMMEGDSFKLTPTMMDEIYSKSKGRVQNFKDNKEQTGALRKLFGEIEYLTLVKRQLDSSYIYPQAPSEELARFYNANAENIEWFKKIRNLAQHYVNDTAGKVQVTPLKITPRKQQVAVYHREGDYVSFLPKQIMTKQDAPYIKAYRLTIDGKPIKGTPTFNFEEHHSTPLSLMQAEAYLTNPNPRNTMEHVLTYQNQRKVNGSKDAHYNKFLVLDKAEHTGVNGIHYNDKWSLQDLQRIKALARSGRFKTMDDLLYYYDRLKAQQLSYLPKAKSGTKLIPKNYFRKDTTI